MSTLTNEEFVKLYSESLKDMSELHNMVLHKFCSYKFFDNFIKLNMNLRNTIKDTKSLFIEIIKRNLNDSVSTIEEAEAAQQEFRRFKNEAVEENN